MDTLIAFFTAIIALLTGVFGYTQDTATTTIQKPGYNLTASTTETFFATGTNAKLVDIEVFTDPDLRYRLLVPHGMAYEYDKDSKSLNIWSKKDHGERIDFAISYSSESQEELRKSNPLTEQEKNREVALKTKEVVIIYRPYATMACHEEGSIFLKKGGALHLYNICGDEEFSPLFNTIISNIEILE